MTELKPCPFCGSEARLGGGVLSIRMACSNIRCRVQQPDHFYSNEAEAVHAWNARPLESVNADLLEALKRIHRRLSAHPDDTPADDRRDKHIAFSIAQGAISLAEKSQ